MKAARIWAILLVVVAGSNFSSAFQTSSRPGAEPKSRIAGTVVDVNDARVVGATIKIENAASKNRLKSDSEGQFEVELPPGTYRVTVEQPGFKKFHLPAFRVGAARCELVNIHLDVARPKMPLKASGTSATTSTRSPGR